MVQNRIYYSYFFVHLSAIFSHANYPAFRHLYNEIMTSCMETVFNETNESNKGPLKTVW